MSNVFERMGEATRLLFTASEQLRYQKERVDKLQSDVDRLGDRLSGLAERVTRVEAARESDRTQFGAERATIIAERAELQTQTTRFQLEVELAIARVNNARALPSVQASETTP